MAALDGFADRFKLDPMRKVVFATVLMALATGGMAQPVPELPPPPVLPLSQNPYEGMDAYGAAMRTRDGLLVQRTPGGAAEFEAIEPWGVRHRPSGLRCSPWPSMDAYALIPSVGRGYAACIFERRNAAGTVEARGEIRILRPVAATLEDVFAAWRTEKLQGMPAAQSRGPVRIFVPRHDFPPVRHEAFLSESKAGAVTTELGVAVVRGWLVEVSKTYQGRFEDDRRREVMRDPQAMLHVMDRTSFASMMSSAITDLQEAP